MNNLKNLSLTLILSAIVLISWQYFYEAPRLKQMQQYNATKKEQAATLKQEALSTVQPTVNREVAVKEGARIPIDSKRIHGSIALKGARFDDISLAEYQETLAKDSKEVVLLSPANSDKAYFAEFGWLATQTDVKVPTADTVWTADKPNLAAGDTLTLSWDNGQGLLFSIAISLDEQYMFRIKQEVKNTKAADIELLPYGLVNRVWTPEHQPFAVLHEGPLGVFNKVLNEAHYKDLKDEGKKEIRDVQEGWLGITDKYWLTALIPDRKHGFDGNFTYVRKNDTDRYQADFLGKKVTIPANGSLSLSHQLFAGAKKVNLLDSYAKNDNITLFDRAIDFGWVYFISKPMFKILQVLHSHVDNFGVAILIMTVIVKLIMFPLANKSYVSMSKMKKLQPEMMRLREKYEQDKMQLNRKVMELYKQEKVNPLSGCLPLIVQIPVFFSLYKVLFVTIEMRHAPFFGWIHDLSAPDPTSLFNLFGLIPWTPPSMLMIGIWPVIMGITMALQQNMNPAPSDPVQAKVMKFLPVLFVYMFHTFPAGLIIYWSWNNLLSILQQWFINRSVQKIEGSAS